MNFSTPLDYEKLVQLIFALKEKYADLSVGYIGATISDRAIPMLTLGNPNASKSVLYLGGVSGGDGATSTVLMRFVFDYCEFLKNGGRLYSVNLPYLFSHRRICVVPMLNCDGCTIRRLGCDDSILKERLLRMNGGANFSGWEANARGVDLRHNFAQGFGIGSCGTGPESEPEVAALCNTVRMQNGTSLLLRLHDDDNTLTVPSDAVSRSRTLARLISRMSATQTNRKTEPTGAPEDWYIAAVGQPAFALGCRYPDTSAPIAAYAYLRELLFSAPLLI